MEKAGQRNSSVELLRLLCIVGIIGMHLFRPFVETQDVLKTEFILLWNSIFNTGVSIFILISGYYGIRFKWEKLFSLIAVIFFYSATTCLIEIFFLKQPITHSFLLLNFFPILSKKYWFITCYVILYILSPFINQYLEILQQEKFKILLIILLLFFVIAPTILISEIMVDNGKGIVNMLLAYMIGRYLALYGFPEIIKHHALKISILCFIVVFSLNSIISIFIKEHLFLQFARDNSVFILVSSVCLLYIFLQKNFNSPVINKLASCVLSIYIIQAFFTNKILFIDENNFYASFIILLIGICCSSVAIELLRRILLGQIFDKTVALMIKIKNELANRL